MLELFDRFNNGFSFNQLFTDFVEMYALCLVNGLEPSHNELWHRREDQYLAVVSKYTKEELEIFCHVAAMLIVSLEKEMRDVLGDVYMRGELGNSRTGQFFTPDHVSKLVADMGDIPDGIITLNEPSCGGCGMVIAYAKRLKEAGYDYQRKLKVIAQDLDWRSVYMSYLQLSLLGIDAVVIQGDTLKGAKPEPWQVFKTPKHVIRL